MHTRLGTLFAALFWTARALWAGENAAPSSHFVFDDNFAGDIVINEVRVPEGGEARYTYYEALGWRGKAAGYAGIQAHPRGHNYIFSIWDHESHRAPIKAAHVGPGTTTEKFGGEGTGLKSWNFELGWKTGVWYTLVARCWPIEDRTHYGFWARAGDTGKWTHLVTMDVAAKEAFFQGGTDAFIEDWSETGKNARTTNLRGGWKRKRDGAWHAFQRGRYSVNKWDLEKGKRSFNFRTSWNGGVTEDETGAFYFMTAGGEETKPAVENPSRHGIRRAEEKPAFEPIRITSATARLQDDGTIAVSWEIDATRLPQFDATVLVSEALEAVDRRGTYAVVQEPGGRSAVLERPGRVELKDLEVRLRCQDILGNMSEDKVIGVTE